jgi:hypothetical protein
MEPAAEAIMEPAMKTAAMKTAKTAAVEAAAATPTTPREGGRSAKQETQPQRREKDEPMFHCYLPPVD